VLRLPHNRLDTRAAEALAGCRLLADLEKLDVSYNRISDDGVRALLVSRWLKNLRVLNVTKNPTRDWDQDRVNEVLAVRPDHGAE
jgi:hypothetical protein